MSRRLLHNQWTEEKDVLNYFTGDIYPTNGSKYITIIEFPCKCDIFILYGLLQKDVTPFTT